MIPLLLYVALAGTLSALIFRDAWRLRSLTLLLVGLWFTTLWGGAAACVVLR